MCQTVYEDNQQINIEMVCEWEKKTTKWETNLHLFSDGSHT